MYIGLFLILNKCIFNLCIDVHARVQVNLIEWVFLITCMLGQEIGNPSEIVLMCTYAMEHYCEVRSCNFVAICGILVMDDDICGEWHVV